MKTLLNSIYFVKELILRIFTLLIALFYMATNGVTVALSMYGLYYFIPKIIKSYQENAEAKLIFYIVVSIIITNLLFKCFKYFIISVKTLILSLSRS